MAKKTTLQEETIPSLHIIKDVVLALMEQGKYSSDYPFRRMTEEVIGLSPSQEKREIFCLLTQEKEPLLILLFYQDHIEINLEEVIIEDFEEAKEKIEELYVTLTKNDMTMIKERKPP